MQAPAVTRRRRFKCRCNGQCTKWRRVLSGPAKKRWLARLAAAVRMKRIADRKKARVIKCNTRTVEWPATEATGEEKSKLLFMLALGLTPATPTSLDAVTNSTQRALPVVAVPKLDSSEVTQAETVTRSRLAEVHRKRKMEARLRRFYLLRMQSRRRPTFRPQAKPEEVSLVSSEEEDDTKTIYLSSEEEDRIKRNLSPPKLRILRTRRASVLKTAPVTLTPRRTLRASPRFLYTPASQQPTGVVHNTIHKFQHGLSRVFCKKGKGKGFALNSTMPSRPRPAILSLLGRVRHQMPRRVAAGPVPGLVPISITEKQPPLHIVSNAKILNASLPVQKSVAFSSPQHEKTRIAPEPIVITIEDDD